MPTYESLPSTCEAEQYLPDQQHSLPAGVYPASVRGEAPGPYVVTAHGQRVYIESGDFIVAEPDGRGGYYPVKPDIFEKRWRLKTELSIWDGSEVVTDETPAPPRPSVEVSPQNGGCWYCRKVDDKLVFCCEFDTYVHLDCVRLARSTNPHDREAEIIAREVFGP